LPELLNKYSPVNNFVREIHTGRREQVIDGPGKLDLPTTFTCAITDHQASDSASDTLEPESNGYWRDQISSPVNAIRTRKLLAIYDIAIVPFGDQCRQFSTNFCAQ
jgi:YtoQ family protein